MAKRRCDLVVVVVLETNQPSTEYRKRSNDTAAAILTSTAMPSVESGTTLNHLHRKRDLQEPPQEQELQLQPSPPDLSSQLLVGVRMVVTYHHMDCIGLKVGLPCCLDFDFLGMQSQRLFRYDGKETCTAMRGGIQL